MIGLDTNMLARFYVDDPNDPEAAKQRPIARRIVTGSEQLFVPLTVILELEWGLRAFYRFDASDFRRVVGTPYWAGPCQRRRMAPGCPGLGLTG